MKNSLTTILFDMDNTLFDLVGAQIASCHAVEEYLGQTKGKSLFEDYFMSNLRGFESHENIRDYLTDCSLSIDGNYHHACRIYEDVKLDHIIPYPGVRDTLATINSHGYPMGIITDAYSRDAMRRLEKSGLLPFFSGIVAYDMVLVKKPAHEPFLFALEMMRAGAENTLLVGDSPRRDIRPARDLGFGTVYARYGDRFSQTRECPEADFIINRMDELIPIVESLGINEK
jgi:putative hydrolase of the HAD superfamily